MKYPLIIIFLYLQNNLCLYASIYKLNLVMIKYLQRKILTALNMRNVPFINPLPSMVVPLR